MALGGLNRPECTDWLIESSLGKSAAPAPSEEPGGEGNQRVFFNVEWGIWGLCSGSRCRCARQILFFHNLSKKDESRAVFITLISGGGVSTDSRDSDVT